MSSPTFYPQSRLSDCLGGVAQNLFASSDEKKNCEFLGLDRPRNNNERKKRLENGICKNSETSVEGTESFVPFFPLFGRSKESQKKKQSHNGSDGPENDMHLHATLA